ncbi:MAG: glycosyl hydrolase, partial [Balneolaceae bacterium]
MKQATFIMKLFILIFFPLLLFTGCGLQEKQALDAWPEITHEQQPWTRWWWQGNSVDRENLTTLLEMYKNAGLGGFEITPIYGVHGEEENFVEFLSPEWVGLLSHTLQEAERLGLGIDMATGTGWPFGGPWIDEIEDTPKNLARLTWELSEGESLEEPVRYVQSPMVRAIGTQVYELHGFLGAEEETPEGTMEDPLQIPDRDPPGIEDLAEPVSANDDLQSLALEQVRFEKELPLITLMAYSERGEIRDLTGFVREDGQLDWSAPEGDWTLYALFQGWHGKWVERAAPGGEGFVIDHFSDQAIERYLDYFDQAFEGTDLSMLRGFFNDSYEVDDAAGEANWTAGFLEAFESYRGYDLRNHLPALFGVGSDEMQRRVLSDYRETISDLLLDTFTDQWANWARDRGAVTRNQAHGSPANILDLYAASDIPETEGRDIFRAKMASSAGNVTGKQLMSTEAATWLNEHFLSTLEDVREDLDRYFLAGINHVVYHGTAYSPPGEEWPGRLFYAAVHFHPNNPFWHHFREFNDYVARVQSFLQSGNPSNDILLYFPIYDRWSTPGNSLLEHFSGGIDDQFNGTHFLEAARQLWERGYPFDYISDRQIQHVETSQGRITSGNSSYDLILLPQSRFIPLETLEEILGLAERGATVISYGGFPESISGYAEYEARGEEYTRLLEEIDFTDTTTQGVLASNYGDGKILQGDDLELLLMEAAVERESMSDMGLQFVRRSHEDGHLYFVKNTGDEQIDGWVPLSRPARSVALFDPMEERSGFGRIRSSGEGLQEVYLQLNQGESVILKTSQSEEHDSDFPYFETTGPGTSLAGSWAVRFAEGGPELPGQLEIEEPRLWTEFEGDVYRNYSGLGLYTHEFPMPDGDADGWLLDLGSVHQSARVRLNGMDLGVLFGPQ